MSTGTSPSQQTAEVLRRNTRGKRESFILNINKNKLTQTTRLMVGKTEFMAPLHVLHQHPTSQPKHAVLQYLQTLHFSGTRLLSEITFKLAHLQSDTRSLSATLMLPVPLLQNPHSLILKWRVSNGAVSIFPELFYSVHEVPSTAESQNKMLCEQRMLSWQKMHGWPPFCSTKQTAPTGPPQQHGRHKAKSFTTEYSLGSLTEATAGVALTSQLVKTLKAQCDQYCHNSHTGKCAHSQIPLTRNYRVVLPLLILTWVWFHSTELVISTLFLN